MSGQGTNPVGHETTVHKAGTLSRSRQQMLRFLLVGGSCVAVDLMVYGILLGKMDRVAAKGISYAAGVLVGFAGNKLWTFESKRKSYSEPIIYVTLYAITLVLNITINSLVCDVCTSLGRTAVAAQLVAFLVATGVTTVLNFLGLKYFAFRHSSIQSA